MGIPDPGFFPGGKIPFKRDFTKVFMRILVYLFCLFLLPIRGLAYSCHAIAINGLTRINASLTLGELIDQAAQGVPEMSLV